MLDRRINKVVNRTKWQYSKIVEQETKAVITTKQNFHDLSVTIILYRKGTKSH